MRGGNSEPQNEMFRKIVKQIRASLENQEQEHVSRQINRYIKKKSNDSIQFFLFSFIHASFKKTRAKEKKTVNLLNSQLLFMAFTYVYAIIINMRVYMSKRLVVTFITLLLFQSFFIRRAQKRKFVQYSKTQKHLPGT